MPNPKKTTGSSPQVLQTVAWCRKAEFQPVPLHPRSKAAISKRYAEPDYKAPPDTFWQNSDFGVGVALGPSHAGPVDIDLDCAEAIAFAPRFLPATAAVFGRRSKPASHFLYRVEEPALAKVSFLDPEQKSTIVELRADGGHQTVLPGSIHQDTGEPIEWTSLPFPEVPKVSADLLEKGVRRIAIATLISRHLWHDGQRNEMTKHLAGLFFYIDWPVEDVEQLVAALDDYHDSHDKTHALTIAATYKRGERGGKIVGATALRKLVEPRIVDKILEWAGSPTVTLLNEYNERFAVVDVEGKFRVARTDVSPGAQPVFYQKDDFLNLYSTDTVTIDDKLVSKAKLWLSSPRRRIYHSIDFLPGVEDTLDILNLWTGWYIQPRKGVCEAWLELLRTVICGDDEQLYQWMLNWFAGIFQAPRLRASTAPVIISMPGAGKTLLLTYIGRILGENIGYMHASNEEHVYGRFNRHLATTLLLHSDEALYGGEQRHRGIIKSLITDEFRIFEPKGIDAKQVRNYLRLILTSNYSHAAPVEAGDRRFTVIDLEQRKVSEELKDRVVAEMDGDGPAALFQYLLEYPFDPKKARTNLKNEALSKLKTIGASPVQSWWLEVLTTGYILPNWLAWAQRPEMAPWPQVVSSSALHLSMVLKLKDRGARQIPSESALAYELAKFIGVKLIRKQMRHTNPLADDAPREVRNLSDRQNTICNLPDLTTCRTAFSVYLGQEIEWPEDEPEEEKPAHERY